MKRKLSNGALFLAFVCAIVLVGAIESHTAGSESRVQRGLAISPVSLNTQGKISRKSAQEVTWSTRNCRA